MNSSSKNKKTWGKKNTRIQRRRDINAICFIGKPQEVKEKKENSIIQIAQTYSFRVPSYHGGVRTETTEKAYAQSWTGT